MHPLDRYYKTLNLPLTATQVEIKKRYRLLAMQYHPDKMGGDQSRFLEIKEAYEYLSGERDYATVNQNNQAGTTTQSRSTSTRNMQSEEERVKRATAARKEKEYKELVENELFYNKLISGWKWKLIHLFAVIGTFIALLIVVDEFLPHRYEQDFVLGVEREGYPGLEGEIRNVILQDNGILPLLNQHVINEGDVILTKTLILHRPLNLYRVQVFPAKIETNYFGNYIEHKILSFALILIIPFMIPFFVIKFKRQTPGFTTAYYFTLAVSIPLIILFMVQHNTWKHIFTLGFL